MKKNILILGGVVLGVLMFVNFRRISVVVNDSKKKVNKAKKIYNKINEIKCLCEE